LNYTRLVMTLKYPNPAPLESADFESSPLPWWRG